MQVPDTGMPEISLRGYQSDEFAIPSLEFQDRGVGD